MPSPPLPSSPGLSKKPHIQFPEQPSTMQQIPSKSRSNSICKTLIVLLLLLLIPFFPSQPPDFISDTVLTKFWEIIRLLFIGIAVSYGLFGRKSEKFECSTDGDPDPYSSGISHLSSIFEDRSGKLCCGTDDQDVIRNYYYYADCDFGDRILGQNKCVLNESLIGKEKNCDGNEKNVNQTWKSNYLKTEPLVLVSNGEDFLGESFEFKPLNLPVRSLRSNVVDDDESESRYSANCEATSKNDVEFKKIRGRVPVNLEKRFDEPDIPSSVPWRSKSGKTENKQESSNTVNQHMHYRPHSFGNFEFEIKHINSTSSDKIPKIYSSPELEISNVGEKVILDDKASFFGSRGRPFSIGDHFEDDNEPGKGKKLVESLDSDTRDLSRAKSVRTKKPSAHITNQKEPYSSRVHGKLEDLKAKSFVKRGKQEEHENPPVDSRTKEADRKFSMPKPKPSLPDYFNEEMEDIFEPSVAESEDERGEDEASEFDESCDEKYAKSNVDYDLGSEVDRKAGEFIAKFRKQIMLQKGSPA